MNKTEKAKIYGFDSTKIIGRVKNRYDEIESNVGEWKGFYHGWLEGRVDMIQQVLDTEIPPSLDTKCNDKWEPLKEPENYKEWSFSLEKALFHNHIECKKYKDARSYRQRIKELEDSNEDTSILLDACKSANEQLKESHKERVERDKATTQANQVEMMDKIEQLIKERDELKTSLTEEVGINDTLSNNVDKLQAFKYYVHERLDAERVEKEPNGKHSEYGCRIGDRLDIVFSELQAMGKDLEEITNELISEEIKCHKLSAENEKLRSIVIDYNLKEQSEYGSLHPSVGDANAFIKDKLKELTAKQR